MKIIDLKIMILINLQKKENGIEKKIFRFTQTN